MKPERPLFKNLAEREKLEKICEKYHVLQMVVFGSAIRSDFNPDTSDIDIMVSFKTMTYTDHADSYFGLLEELEQLFGRSVDLLEEKAVKNPYLKKSIDDSGVLVYASA
ncbi:nucleotidyltransferase domain-containing protein [Methanogenium marinum]|uniref:protein adenylyltransferase n=1 Tax=Methanogenium marinum TaxID=348610 RepID=A0A9Q4PYI7_9EURY|nr:nucleotidyltransferase domain-containing protein [Methanogenium marinum]MDE4908788.1 nucleotidyltransferase domain-containing protein [Methanogenium marinum]